MRVAESACKIKAKREREFESHQLDSSSFGPGFIANFLTDIFFYIFAQLCYIFIDCSIYLVFG